MGAARIVVPIACLYTPLKEIENMALVQYNPVPCNTCSTVLNPYCTCDFRFKTWVCSTCTTKNNFPQHYAQHITESQLPAELINDYTTIEYIIPEAAKVQKPIFLLLVDTAVPSEELTELKDSLQQSINFIPEDALIGLITYGKNVFVHELGFTDMPKAFVFSGVKAATAKEVQD